MFSTHVMYDKSILRVLTSTCSIYNLAKKLTGKFFDNNEILCKFLHNLLHEFFNVGLSLPVLHDTRNVSYSNHPDHHSRLMTCKHKLLTISAFCTFYNLSSSKLNHFPNPNAVQIYKFVQNIGCSFRSDLKSLASLNCYLHFSVFHDTSW